MSESRFLSRRHRSCLGEGIVETLPDIARLNCCDVCERATEIQTFDIMTIFAFNVKFVLNAYKMKTGKD